MTQGLNMVILVGRLGVDPDIHTFSDGNRHAVLSLATSSRWKDRTTGERRERTEWHRVVLKRRHDADRAENYCCKGSLVRVIGRIRNRRYVQNGTEKSITEIIVAGHQCEFELLAGGRPHMMTGNAATLGAQTPRTPALGSDPNAPLDYRQAKGG